MHCMVLWCWSDTISAKMARLSFNPQQCQIYYYLLVVMGLGVSDWEDTVVLQLPLMGFFWYNNQQSYIRLICFNTQDFFFFFFHCAVGCCDHISFLSGAPQDELDKCNHLKTITGPSAIF